MSSLRVLWVSSGAGETETVSVSGPAPCGAGPGKVAGLGVWPKKRDRKEKVRGPDVRRVGGGESVIPGIQ